MLEYLYDNAIHIITFTIDVTRHLFPLNQTKKQNSRERMHQMNASTVVVNFDTEKDGGATRIFLSPNIMSNSDENTQGEVYDAAYSIVNKIEDIQNEARDLLTMIGDLPTNGEPLSGDANLPRQWGKATAIKLLSSVEFPDKSISTTGNGPWSEDDMDGLILGLNNKVYELGDEVFIVVVGYDSENIEEIREHIENSENIVQIYPQELFMSYLFTGEDPLLLLSEEQAQHWIEFHPALNALFGGDDDVFPWPLIQPDDDGPVLDEEKVLSLGLDQSPLNLMGYITGETRGLDEDERQDILNNAFVGDIPEVDRVEDVDTDAYMAQWGNPNTPRRLWRIAKHLANLHHIHRKKSNFKTAKMHWKSDLQWLGKMFHTSRRYRFTWPG